MSEKRYTVRLDERTQAALESLCTEHDRAASSMIRVLIQVAAGVADVGICSSVVRQRFVSGASDVRHLSAERRTDDAQVTHGADSATHARDTSSSEIRKGERRGSGGGNTSEQARTVSLKVITQINDRRKSGIPNAKGFDPEDYQQQIAKILRGGKGRKPATEEDILELVDLRAREAKRKNDWSWFTAPTLLRPTKFWENLDMARSFAEAPPRPAGREPKQEQLAPYLRGTKYDPNVKQQ